MSDDKEEENKEVANKKEEIKKRVPKEVNSKKRPGKRLTDKMRLFCQEYMKDMNKRQAVLRAGYDTKNPDQMAEQLWAHPMVKAEIARLQELKSADNELTTKYVITKLITIVEDNQSSNPTAALRGLELLGKHLGLYKERQEISGPDGEAIQMEQKVKQDVADFTSRLSRLAASGGEGQVVGFPKRSRESGS